MYPHEASHVRPLVVCFCCDRFDLLRMALPRIVNATRQIGGYLWCIDDASDDDRVPRRLKDWHGKGWIDWITLGKKRRFIDWINSNMERRSVVIRWLYRHSSPLAFLVESDVVIGRNVLEDMLERAIKVLKVNPNIYAFSGSHGNTTVFNYPSRSIDHFEVRFLGRYLTQQVVLFPIYPMRWVDKKRPLKDIRYFSLNEYAVVAHETGLTSCIFMQMETQHLGVGINGSFAGPSRAGFEAVSYIDGQQSGFVQVAGFKVDSFMKIAGQTTLAVQNFAKRDEAAQVIIEPQPVSEGFRKFVEEVSA